MVISYVDCLIIFFYLLSIIFMGFRFAARQRTAKVFMVADQALPGWLIGFSIFASFTSNITLIGTTGKAYESNWSAFAFSLALPVVILLSNRFFVSFHRKKGHFSAYTHLEERFGTWAGAYGAFFYVVMQIVRMGVIMYLIALALSPLFYINEYTLIIVTGVVVMTYTYLGGIEAVIWTDFIQGAILVGGVVLSVAYLLFNLPQGFEQFFQVAQAHNKLSMGGWIPSFTKESFWLMFLLGLTVYLQDFSINQTYVQRYIAAESDQAAKRGLWLNFWIYLPFMFLIFLLGTLLFVFYNTQPDLMEFEGVYGLKTDSIFPHFIAHHLPTGIRGLLIACILSGAMSSIDSSLNGISTVFYMNFYKNYINKSPNEAQSLKVLHLTSVVCGLLGIGIAISMMHVKSIWDAWYIISTAVGGAVFGLFLLGFISSKATKRSAIIATCVGILLFIWMSLSPNIKELPSFLKYPFHSFFAASLGTCAIITIGHLYACRNAKKKKEEEL